MNLVISKYYGFCPGVNITVNKIDNLLRENKTIYCLGEPAHNENVIEELKEKGLIIIDEIQDAKEHVCFRAHGVTKETYLKALENNLKITDLTCPKVLSVHKIADDYSKRDYYIFYIAKKNHPETIGTESYCKNYTTIDSIEDINQAIEKYKSSNLKKILIINQTTYNINKRKEIIDIIIGKLDNIDVIDTTCNATDLRQKEAIEISKNVDLLIVIGGKKSHNTRELYEITKNNCEVIMIDNINDLNIEKTKYKTIGITSGASTSQKIVGEIIEHLNK